MSRISFPAILLVACLAAPAQEFEDLAKRITDFTLPNGMRFVVAERHDAPVIAFRILVGAGSIHDPAGAAGLARLFERLVLEGPETLGTRDAAGEKRAIAAIEEAYDRLEAERYQGRSGNDAKIAVLELEVQKAVSEARGFQTGNEFAHAFDDAGFSGFGATAGIDFTLLQFTAPSNRAELWFSLESQWLQRPVFRNFYQERDRAVEDYHKQVEMNPEARLLQALSTAAFTAHPYRNPVAGWPSDLAHLRQPDARQFFDRYYAPGNITVAMAGDITPDEARRLAERYFGPIPVRPRPPAVHTKEPAQTGPRSVTMEIATQPVLAVGYPRPDQYDREEPALRLIQAILATGRGGWLTQELVEGKRIATAVQARSTFPAGRYPHLFMFVVTVAPGYTTEENERALTAVLARLQNEKIDEATLARAKALTRAAVLRRLSDNGAIATMLAAAAADRGDWRRLIAEYDGYNKVTAEQIQLAAVKCFVPARRTSVYLVPPPPVPAAAAKGGVE